MYNNLIALAKTIAELDPKGRNRPSALLALASSAATEN